VIILARHLLLIARMEVHKMQRRSMDAMCLHVPVVTVTPTQSHLVN
jgi:hypothetical protein